MSTEFLETLWESPRPAFVAELGERLRALEAREERRARPRRVAWLPIAATFLMLLAGSLAFPAVRAGVVAVLDLFQDRSVARVRFDPERVAPLRGRLADRSPALLLFAEPVREREPGTKHAFPTAEAAARAGWTLAVPNPPPPGFRLERVEVAGAGGERLGVDRQALEEAFDLLDLAEVKTPRRLEEASIEVPLPPLASLVYSGPGGEARLGECAVPDVEVPRGVDLRLLGEIGLRVAGVEADEAFRLSRSIDWRSTLIVPFPPGASELREVTVGGTWGLLVGGVPETGGAPRHTLTWTHAGRLYWLTGTASAEDLVRLAEAVPTPGT